MIDATITQETPESSTAVPLGGEGELDHCAAAVDDIVAAFR